MKTLILFFTTKQQKGAGKFEYFEKDQTFDRKNSTLSSIHYKHNDASPFLFKHAAVVRTATRLDSIQLTLVHAVDRSDLFILVKSVLKTFIFSQSTISAVSVASPTFS